MSVSLKVQLASTHPWRKIITPQRDTSLLGHANSSPSERKKSFNATAYGGNAGVADGDIINNLINIQSFL